MSMKKWIKYRTNYIKGSTVVRSTWSKVDEEESNSNS
jgi:hypothetical protein